MRTYLLKRLLLLPITLFGITLISFFIIHLAPGDPGSLKRHGMSEGNKAAAESRRGSEDAIKKWRAQYHLDRSIPAQYGLWIERLVIGDREGKEGLWGALRNGRFTATLIRGVIHGKGRLGTTFLSNKDIWEEMKEPLWLSMKLEAAALSLIFLVALPLGIYSAWRPATFFDRASSLGLFVLYSLPAFWAATMLIIWFGDREHPFLGIWFPVSGLHDDRLIDPPWWRYQLDLLHHTFLPILCLSYGTLAVVSRYMRAGMLDVIRQDFIRTARSKGLEERRVVLKHALRNALFPIVTLAASLLPAVVAGSIIVEVIFTIPGMGWYAIDAIHNREYNILMATFLLSGVMELVAILLADVTYALLDPRVSFDKAAS